MSCKKCAHTLYKSRQQILRLLCRTLRGLSKSDVRYYIRGGLRLSHSFCHNGWTHFFNGGQNGLTATKERYVMCESSVSASSSRHRQFQCWGSSHFTRTDRCFWWRNCKYNFTANRFFNCRSDRFIILEECDQVCICCEICPCQKRRLSCSGRRYGSRNSYWFS